MNNILFLNFCCKCSYYKIMAKLHSKIPYPNPNLVIKYLPKFFIFLRNLDIVVSTVLKETLESHTLLRISCLECILFLFFIRNSRRLNLFFVRLISSHSIVHTFMSKLRFSSLNTSSFITFNFYCALIQIQTGNLQLRRLLLYSIELWERKVYSIEYI